jgi:short-subunit dehydrogenase
VTRLPSRHIAGQRVWIIGASSGIGAALARELHSRGAQVAISGRRAAELEQVSSGDMTVLPLDATDGGALAASAREARRAMGGLDTVVWCAAYWEQTDPKKWDAASFARHVELNLLGFNALLGAVLPGMVERRAGHIVGIASVAGFRGFPGGEAYGATKAAQIALLESLRASLWRSGVRVTTVAPGFVKTALTDINEFPMPFIISAEKAARSIARGLERGQVEIVFPFRMAVAMKIARLLPIRWWAVLYSRAGAASSGDRPSANRRDGQAPSA